MIATPLAPEGSAFLDVFLLALVQGLTEFLPVSSSGHLVLTQAALDFREPALLWSVALHLGTLVAVLVVYRRSLAEVAFESMRGRPRALALVLLGTLPAAVIGLSLHDWFEQSFASVRGVALGLLVTAGVLIAGERARKRSAQASEPPAGGASDVLSRDGRRVTARDALLVGLGQAFAIYPGVSRSGTTIAVGLLLGLRPAQAARLSFLLAVPAIGGAAILEGRALVVDGVARETGAGLLLWSAGFAALVGWGALRLLLAFLARGAFRWFAVYCAALGGAVLVFGSLGS